MTEEQLKHIVALQHERDDLELSIDMLSSYAKRERQQNSDCLILVSECGLNSDIPLYGKYVEPLKSEIVEAMNNVINDARNNILVKIQKRIDEINDEISKL
jgi:hypothetical protein